MGLSRVKALLVLTVESYFSITFETQIVRTVSQVPIRYFSVSRAALHPDPAAAIACR